MFRPVVVACALVALTGCFGDDAEPDEVATDEQLPISSVTVPPERLTPFCEAMIDLSDRLERDPPDDTNAFIIEAYEEIRGEVPAEIAPEFDAVLARLRGEAPPPTTEPPVTFATVPPITDASGSTLPPEGDQFFEEGYTPDDDPAQRVNDYVDFTCRDAVNNPGPPATQPLSPVETTEG